MFDPKSCVDTYGYCTDFENRPYVARTAIISVDARNRDPALDTPSSFTLQVPALRQVRSIELRDGFVTLPQGYTDPYALLFLEVDGNKVGSIVNAGPIEAPRAGPATLVNHDAAQGAFAQLIAAPSGFFVSANNVRRIVLRFPGTPLPQMSRIKVRLTDIDGVPLVLADEASNPPGTARVWLQLEVSSSAKPPSG